LFHNSSLTDTTS